MKPLLFRFLFIAVLISIDIAFIPIAFSSLVVLPSALVSLAASWALLRGFAPLWPWALLAGVLFDACAFGRIGVSMFELLLALAGFSVVSKRFLSGHPGEQILVFGSAVWIFHMLFQASRLFAANPHIANFLHVVPASFFSWALIPSWLLSLCIFSLVLHGTRIFERYLELFEGIHVGARR